MKENLFQEDKTVFCMRCDHEMILDESEDFGEGNVYRYHCPYCGAIEECYECHEDDRENYPYYSENAEDNGLGSSSHGYNGLCPICGSHIIWGADFMRSEIIGDVDNEDDDSLASNVSCPHCGASIDVIDCKPSEYKDYPAYLENCENELNDN